MTDLLALQTWPEVRADVAAYWYVYLAMPIIAAFIGYITKIIAIEMLYRPLEFKGVGPIGWQGIIPRRAGKVAAITIDLLTARLLQPAELFAKFDAQRAVAELREPLAVTIDEMAREFAEELRPGVWDTLPVAARRAIRERLQAQAPDLIDRMLAEVQSDLPQYLDLQYLAVSTLVRNKAKLDRLLRQTGVSAATFMRRSGIVFGFLIGIVQAVAWAWIHELWLMPLFGFITGLLSDWLALNLLFIPREPKRILGVTFQGVIQRRRELITRDYARIMAEDLFGPEALTDALLNGPSSDRVFAMVQREVSHAIDRQAGVAGPLVQLAVGSARYREAKAGAVQRVVAEIPQTVAQVREYTAEVMDIERTILEKMQQLDSAEFESIMRPVFKDDEGLVILLGALLGAAVGELQVHLLIVPLTGA